MFGPVNLSLSNSDRRGKFVDIWKKNQKLISVRDLLEIVDLDFLCLRSSHYFIQIGSLYLQSKKLLLIS